MIASIISSLTVIVSLNSVQLLRNTLNIPDFSTINPSVTFFEKVQPQIHLYLLMKLLKWRFCHDDVVRHLERTPTKDAKLSYGSTFFRKI